MCICLYYRKSNESSERGARVCKLKISFARNFPVDEILFTNSDVDDDDGTDTVVFCSLVSNCIMEKIDFFSFARVELSASLYRIRLEKTFFF